MRRTTVSDTSGGGTKTRSRYVGVSWDRQKLKWRVQFTVKGKRQFLGYFVSEECAGRAYDAAVVEQNLQRPVNFPAGEVMVERATKRRKNVRDIPNKGKSTFFGVSWDKNNKMWKVQTTVKSKKMNLGYYDVEADAAHAYDAAVIKNGLDRDLNFQEAAEAAGYVPEQSRFMHSRHRGVNWNKTSKKWIATITIDKKRQRLGSFVDEASAGRAYDAAVREHFPGEEKPLRWKGFNFADEVGSGAVSAVAGGAAAPTRKRKRKRKRKPAGGAAAAAAAQSHAAGARDIGSALALLANAGHALLPLPVLGRSSAESTTASAAASAATAPSRRGARAVSAGVIATGVTARAGHVVHHHVSVARSSSSFEVEMDDRLLPRD